MKLFVFALGILILAIGSDAGASMHNPFFCYATDFIRSMTNMHSVFTSYEAIRRFNFTTVNPYISRCTPSKIWYLGRYGGRYPHTAALQRMLNLATLQANIVTNYEAGRTTLCRQDFEAIRDWTPPSDFVLSNAGLATEAGQIAMQNIARRYQQAFPNILTETYSPERFLFRHTITERTNTSLRAFATGLFGEAGAQNVIYEDVPDFDWFLRPFDVCPAYSEETANWFLPRQAYLNGPEVAEMMQEINAKLGFQLSPLNFDTVFDMWNWCRFETATRFEQSESETGPDATWCAAFSVSHCLLLEYADDLGHFYNTGYGVRNQRLLENMNCGVIQDLLNHVQSNSDSDTLARFFVTSSVRSYDTQEVLLILVALGLFRDTWPLHQHNFAQQSARHWSTSLIGAFGSHFSVIRFDCEGEDDDLVFLLNERQILVPGCDQQTGVCKVSTFVNRFQRFIDANCEEYFCTTD